MASWPIRSASRVLSLEKATPTNQPWRILHPRFVFTLRHSAKKFWKTNRRYWKHFWPKPRSSDGQVSCRCVIRAQVKLGFEVVREREHISMLRRNPDGTTTPLTLPNHSYMKSSTLRTICT